MCCKGPNLLFKTSVAISSMILLSVWNVATGDTPKQIAAPEKNQKRINRESYEKIQEGMDEDQVNKILGCQWGPHYVGEIVFVMTLGDGHSLFHGRSLSKEILFPRKETDEDGRDTGFLDTKAWVGNEFAICVRFSRGIVRSKEIRPVLTRKE